MTLRAAREALIAALEAGTYEHEARPALAEKNLFATGEVNQAFVIRLLQRTRGEQYSTRQHDWDSDTTVHVFRPEVDGQRWYVKAYFLDATSGMAVFISVHR